MQPLVRTSHSANNETIFRLTTANHRDYCLKHEYIYQPVDEPYHPHIEPLKVADLLDSHPLVLLMGCDVKIQRFDDTLESYATGGLSIAHEIRGGILNGDMLLFKSCQNSYDLLDLLLKHQHNYPHTQAAINALYLAYPEFIHDVPKMQIVAPCMNPGVNYRNVNTRDYFSVHYCTIGKRADLKEKEYYLSTYKN